jgi:hypothetical protein
MKNRAILEKKIMLKWHNEAIFLSPGEKVDIIDFVPPDKIIICKGLFQAVITQDDATVDTEEAEREK